MRAICDEMDIGIDIDLWMDETPVPMDSKLVSPLPNCVKRTAELPCDAQRRGP